MSALKDIYTEEFYDNLAKALGRVLPEFDAEAFHQLIYTSEFERMELKERMRHTTTVMHHFLPGHFPDAVKVIFRLIDVLRARGQKDDRLVYIFLPDYVEVYGLEDLDTSIEAMEFITQFISCEYAVRPFIIRYHEQMMQQLLLWSKHEHASVRRLASEGSRPRLPWGIAIPRLKKDPSPLLPILENLKNDVSEVVRRSVANNLNDISKDHPELVIQVAKAWAGQSNETDAIIKHGCRTLLKSGDPQILGFYGLDSDGLLIQDFKIEDPDVQIGSSLAFSFRLQNTNSIAKRIRLEYGLYYYKANGTLARKVFKISERVYGPHEVALIARKQSFKLITTRVFYEGEHQLSLILNGIEQSELILKFNLCAAPGHQN